MKSFSFADSDKLNFDLNAALAAGAALNDLPSKASTIKQFHKKLRTQPQTAFENLAQQIREKILLAHKDNLASALLGDLNKSINEINKHKLVGFLPEGADATTCWQYRYALLVGCLYDWKQKHANSEEAAIKICLEHITKTLEPYHSEDYPILAWIQDKEIRQCQTYVSLYKTAIEQQILTNYDSNEEYKQGVEKQIRDKAELEAKLITAEADYNNSLQYFKTLLDTLNAAQILNEENELVTTIVEAGKHLHQKFNSNLLTHLTAAEILTHENHMLVNLMKSLQPNITHAERNDYIRQTEEAAIHVGMLLDDRMKMLDADFLRQHPDQNYDKFVAATLLFIAATLVFLAIAALVASSPGSFLGIAFALTKTVMVKGTLVSHASDAAVGCILGGIYGLIFGLPLLAAAITNLFSLEKSEPKSRVEEFKQRTDALNTNLKKATRHVKSYPHFFAVPEDQKEGKQGNDIDHVRALGDASDEPPITLMKEGELNGRDMALNDAPEGQQSFAAEAREEKGEPGEPGEDAVDQPSMYVRPGGC
jgi:hypothetical protein